jgi:anti-sigma regulatory factor (Ser/Thr protein kinase)
MTKQLDLTLLNQPAEIGRAQDELEQFAAACGLADRALHEAQLALEEHLSNIVKYAFKDKQSHQIKVRLRFNRPELQIEVEDDGPPFNPLTRPAPDLSLPIDQRPIGGLGTYMIQKALDHVEYRRDQDKNVLVMIKRA